MPIVTILEAFYGSGVVLDYSEPVGREAALELSLRTVERMESDASRFYSLKFHGEGIDDLTEWHKTESRDAVLAYLREHVIPEYRHYRVLLRAGETKPYSFAVLEEDDACICVGPAWQATNAWYDTFWATLWAEGQELEDSDATFRLVPSFGDRFCASGHRFSPFQDVCAICGKAPAPRKNGAG